MQTRENHGSCALTWCRSFDSVKLPEKERKYNGSLIFSRSDRRVGIDLPTIFRYGGLNFSQDQAFEVSLILNLSTYVHILTVGRIECHTPSK